MFGKRYRGWILIYFVFGIHLLALSGFEQSIYEMYQKLIYTPLRWVYDYTLGWSPIPMIYLFIGFLVWMVFRLIRKIIIYNKVGHGWKYSTTLFFRLIRLVLTVLSLFYLLWGFNYYRLPLNEQLGWSTVEVDSTELIREFEKVTKEVQELRLKLKADTSALRFRPNVTSIENKSRIGQGDVRSTVKLPHPDRVRVRALRPKGALLVFSTAGIYIPFVMEGHFDTGLNELQWPFTLAHEMAHGYGITNEGACNFIGLLTCLHSEDTFIKYSGLLGYWRYLFYEVNLCDSILAQNTFNSIDAGVRADIEMIRMDAARYPDILPYMRDKVYDYYLKMHGVDSGIESYNEMIQWMIEWRKVSEN